MLPLLSIGRKPPTNSRLMAGIDRARMLKGIGMLNWDVKGKLWSLP